VSPKKRWVASSLASKEDVEGLARFVSLSEVQSRSSKFQVRKFNSGLEDQSIVLLAIPGEAGFHSHIYRLRRADKNMRKGSLGGNMGTGISPE